MSHNVDHEKKLDLFNNDNVAMTGDSTGSEAGQYVLRGSKRMVFCWGDTFASGTATVQLSPDHGVTWFDTAVTFTENGFADIDHGWTHNEIMMRAQLAGTVAGTLSLTGAIDPTASTAVVGVGTLFTTELILGQSIIINAETRIVDSITDNTNLTVTVAFTDTGNDLSPEKIEIVDVKCEMR